ncbi:MAG: ATP-binding protein [Bdellovibrionales bacterium]
MSAKSSKKSTTTSTASRPSTGSDTAIKKTDKNEEGRWLRYNALRQDLPEIDHIFDLYWGGPERRITGLTLRIISVNAIALLILMIGILYLGQYQNTLIESKLENFRTETLVIAEALGTGAASDQNNSLSPAKATDMAKKLAAASHQTIAIFSADQTLITENKGDVTQNDRNQLRSIRILKDMAALIVNLMPDKQTLPAYPPHEYPGAEEALLGNLSLSAWQNEDSTVTLSAAAPIIAQNRIIGAVHLKREAKDIEDNITAVWIDVLRIFLGTFIVTTLLSIYLSGVIARPLKKLARAAENVRMGRSKGSDIPDFSDRNDEIGELSLALKAMTAALWERMDSIESFAADVSHELKNPLTSLRSAIETLDLVKKKEDREKLTSIIKHDIARMERLITDISNASRLDAALSREAFETIDIAAIITDIIALYQDPLTRHQNSLEAITGDKIRITLDAPKDKPARAQGSIERLGQVFRNILDNALSFAPPQSHITITIRHSAKNIRVTIEDEGPGIPESKIQTIFERFYSERPKAEDYGNHSGLGLSICKQIIDAHQGEIFAENIKDANSAITGARFTVVLPSA